MVAPGMQMNIGINSLRIPAKVSTANTNAVDINPQKATRPVFSGFMRLRSFSDKTLIYCGLKRTKTAVAVKIAAIDKLMIKTSMRGYF